MKKWVTLNRLKIPMKIYHYTDLNGLKGIVENHSLWATNLKFLNDEGEMRHGLDTFSSALSYLESDLEKYLYDVFRQTLENHKLHYERHSYNISFCQNPDLLSQWRGYAATHGVCLEFDNEELERCLDFSDLAVTSRSVFYTQPDSTLEAKDEILNFIKSDEFLLKRNNLFHEWDKSAVLINRLVPFFKHASFKEESEYRIVVQPHVRSAKVKFRVNEHGLIPYLDIKARMNNVYSGKLPLKSVKIGPCKNRSFISEGISFLLNYNGYRDTTLSFTEAPFRS